MALNRPASVALVSSYLMMLFGLYCISDGLLNRPYPFPGYATRVLPAELRIFFGIAIIYGGLFGFLKHYAYPTCRINDNPLFLFIVYALAWTIWPWLIVVNDVVFYEWTLEFSGLMLLLAAMMYGWVRKVC